ncbi:DJ-1/PfpI family protein [Sulfidibacter corallicola]|uniref:DJ-1/PfpI family protein n=1 Tax=Sulfidibacter corallicola TaxID=2818388 RepID=A0A8A4TUX5_SULCO|nr:DJ-1 family glyoxalase III [Sulfidibacter corallicola]QTD53157.1 DJ-1/PfpI family protein [Sulfidibacter corallicola]
MSQVLVPLADGFEEIEAISVIDLLRRSQIEVTVAGVSGRSAMGAHQIAVQTDATLDEVVERPFDMVVLPGGMPGAQTLRENGQLAHKIKAMNDEGKWIAAICAAPMALAAAGVLVGRRATSYPGFLDEFEDVRQTGAPVERDDRIITARGPGAAMDFALTLIEVLAGKETRDTIEAGLQRP